MNTLTANHERQRLSRELVNTHGDLERGSSYRIRSDLKGFEPQLLATIHTSRERYATRQGIADGEVDEILVFDLRNVPVEEQGGKSFNGQLLSPDTEYIVIDPNQLDWDAGQGYKGLRKEESFQYGRPTEETPASDKRWRFRKASALTSRKHFQLAVDPSGELHISDNSTNGTSIATGDRALDAALSPRFQAEAYEETVKRLDKREVSDVAAGPESLVDEGALLSAEVVRRLAEKARDRSEHLLTRELLSAPEYQPVAGMRLDNKNFYFSAVQVAKGGRQFAYCYVDEGKRGVPLKPRLFYKSNSDGGWRSTPYVEPDGHISKGPDRYQQYGGYVQITKPVDALSQLLQGIEESVPKNDRFSFQQGVMETFGIGRVVKEKIHSFDEEVRVVNFAKNDSRYRGLNAYEPGRGYTDSRRVSSADIEHMQLPAGFEPDFTKAPVRRFRAEHTLAGTVQVSIYRTEYQGKTLDWHVANDSKGGVWLDKVAMEGGGVTSYGTSKEVLLLGALSAKPFEYATQTTNMHEGYDYDPYNTSYVDLRHKYWGRMPWVRRYKQARARG